MKTLPVVYLLIATAALSQAASTVPEAQTISATDVIFRITGVQAGGGEAFNTANAASFLTKFTETTGFTGVGQGTGNGDNLESFYEISGDYSQLSIYTACDPENYTCPGTVLRPIETKHKAQALLNLAINSLEMGDGQTIEEWDNETITLSSVEMIEFPEIAVVEIGTINTDEEYSITQCDTRRCTTRKVTHVVTRSPFGSHLQAETSDLVQMYLTDQEMSDSGAKEDPHVNIMKDSFTSESSPWKWCGDADTTNSGPWQGSDYFSAGEQDPVTWISDPTGYETDPGPRSIDAGDPTFHTVQSNKRGNYAGFRNGTTRVLIAANDGETDHCLTALDGAAFKKEAVDLYYPETVQEEVVVAPHSAEEVAYSEPEAVVAEEAEAPYSEPAAVAEEEVESIYSEPVVWE